MWFLFHKLFGWHYVLYRDSATSFITRVKRAPNGDLYIRDCNGIYHYRLAGCGKFKEGERSRHYIPLTFTEKESK